MRSSNELDLDWREWVGEKAPVNAADPTILPLDPFDPQELVLLDDANDDAKPAEPAEIRIISISVISAMLELNERKYKWFVLITC